MIYEESQMGVGSPFQGNYDSDLRWNFQSPIPPLTAYPDWDPAAQGEQEATMADNAALAWTLGMRTTVGVVATRTGYTRSAIPALRDLYNGSNANAQHQAASVFVDFAKAGGDISRMTTDWTDVGLLIGAEALGYIPVVGWFLKLGLGAIRVGLAIRQAIANKKREAAIRELAKRRIVPLAEYNRDADSVRTRLVMKAVSEYCPEWIVMPRFPAKKVGDIEAIPAGLEDEPHTYAWLVFGEAPDIEESDVLDICQAIGSVGLGLIPGTRVVHGPMQLPTHGCGSGSVMEVGSYFPSSSGVANQWLTQLYRTGPSLYTIRAHRIRDAWDDYVWAMIAWAQSKVSGWSCDEWVAEAYDTKNAKGDPVKGTGHRDALLGYLTKLFFGWENEEGDYGFNQGWVQGGNAPLADRLNFDVSNYAYALDDLEARQVLALDSIECFYVHPWRVRHAGNDVYPFPAIAKALSPQMWQKWDTNIRALFESGDWKRVYMPDVPDFIGDGEPNPVKQELRERGLPEQPPPGLHQYMPEFAAPTVLGDPEIPPAPKPGGTPGLPGLDLAGQRKPMFPPPPTKPKRRRKGVSTTTKVAVAAGAGALAWTQRERIARLVRGR